MKLDIQLVAFTGFYSGTWDWDYIFEDAMYWIESEHECRLEYKYDWEVPDRNDWQANFTMAYARCFFDILEACTGLQFKCDSVSLWSPHAYNYMTDQIDCVASIEDEEWRTKLLALMEENKEALSTIIHKRHSSAPGVISFMSNSYDEWCKVISGKSEEEDDMLYISCILSYLVEVKNHMSKTALNEFIYVVLRDEGVLNATLEPSTECAQKEWERILEEEKLKKVMGYSPCIPGLQ